MIGSAVYVRGFGILCHLLLSSFFFKWHFSIFNRDNCFSITNNYRRLDYLSLCFIHIFLVLFPNPISSLLMLCCCRILLWILFEKLFLHGKKFQLGKPKSIKHAIEICNFFTRYNSSSDVQPLLVQMLLLTVIIVFSFMKHSVWSNLCPSWFLHLEVSRNSFLSVLLL